MAALSDFPSFTSSTQLFKALRSQGFQVDRRGPGYRVTAHDGAFVFIHSGSITDRSGARSRNILKELVGLGFVPPAEYELRKREKRAMAVILKGEAEVEVEEAQEQEPTEAPVDTEPDPKRALPCPACAEQRCHICIKKELPCAFARALNLGRHTTSVHGAVPQHSQMGRPRTGRVRTRVDPDVIPNVVGRRIVQLKRLTAEIVLTMDELTTEAEKLRQENMEQRKLVADMERRVNEIYDTMTKPR